jgi:hypothetical protein
MSLEDAFILGNVRELLSPVCDPQLRLVSKSCNAAMATVPHEQIRLEDFLSSLGLFLWAVEVLEVPWGEELCKVAAGGGHLGCCSGCARRSLSAFGAWTRARRRCGRGSWASCCGGCGSRRRPVRRTSVHPVRRLGAGTSICCGCCRSRRLSLSEERRRWRLLRAEGR